jgi:hypothetical protein
MQTKNIFFDEIARLMAIPFLLGSSSIAALSAVDNKPMTFLILKAKLSL